MEDNNPAMAQSTQKDIRFPLVDSPHWKIPTQHPFVSNSHFLTEAKPESQNLALVVGFEGR